MSTTKFFATFSLVLIFMLILTTNVAQLPGLENPLRPNLIQPSCGQSSKVLAQIKSSSHPFLDISFKEKKEVIGEDKEKIVKKVLDHADIKNALQDQEFQMESAQIKVVKHTLGDGNTLLAVGFVTEENFLIFYEVENPLVKHVKSLNGSQETIGDEYIYKSQASLFNVDAQLLSISINGRLIEKPSEEATTQSEDCSICVDLYNWNYYGGYCTHYDGGCIFRCCAACVVACAGGATPSCLACAFLWCPICAMSCCDQTEYGCIYCG